MRRFVAVRKVPAQTPAHLVGHRQCMMAKPVPRLSPEEIRSVIEIAWDMWVFLTELQREANRRYGYTANQTLDAAQALYEDVRAVYQQIMTELRVGTVCKKYQVRTCELFEARGHATVRSDPQTQSGYVHSLGHGLGLHVHERPFFGLNSADDDLLNPGVIVTIEPGLYYPERGLGVRLEDTVWVRPDGGMEILAPYPLDLVIPVGK